MQYPPFYSVGCKCRNDIDEEGAVQGDEGGGGAGGLDQLMAGTPSKVCRLDKKPQENPRDKQTYREARAKPLIVKNIKFAFEEAQKTLKQVTLF